MVYGIGCDLCSIARMEKSLLAPHGAVFARRVFGPAEQAALGLPLAEEEETARRTAPYRGQCGGGLCGQGGFPQGGGHRSAGALLPLRDRSRPPCPAGHRAYHFSGLDAPSGWKHAACGRTFP